MHPTSGDANTWRHTRLTKDGYYERRWWDGPRPYRKQRSQREHRWVWEQTHGEMVPEGHDVHHRDGNRLNNDPANLEAVPTPEHVAAHGLAHRRPQCPKCGQPKGRNHAGWCRACTNAYARAKYHAAHPEAQYQRRYQAEALTKGN